MRIHSSIIELMFDSEDGGLLDSEIGLQVIAKSEGPGGAI